MVLDCFMALNDAELDKYYRLLISTFIFYEPFKTLDDVVKLDNGILEKLITEMFNFFNCGEQEVQQESQHKLVDWEQDEQLIMSAINFVAGKEVRIEPYVHWWTFMGYYMAIGESSLSFVVSIRKKIIEGKSLDKEERRFKRNNPQYFNWNHKTVEEQELDNLVMNLWNKT